MGFKYKQFYVDGEAVEDLFVSVLKQMGFFARKATKEENRIDKIDVFFGATEDNMSWGVDVKKYSKNKRNSSVARPRVRWLEIKGITGHDGWCYGKSKYIAFETPKSFWLVKTKDLRNWIAENVDFSKYASNAYDAHKILYTRAGRQDLMTVILEEELKQLVSKEIIKPVSASNFEFDDARDTVIQLCNKLRNSPEYASDVDSLMSYFGLELQG